MKKLIVFTFVYGLAGFAVQAQETKSREKILEFGVGVSTPHLFSGSELMASQSIRQEGLSYYLNQEGSRNQVGSYPILMGFNFNIAYYNPSKRVEGLYVGASLRNSQTGSQPTEGGYEEGYFFNFLVAGLAARYYPSPSSSIYLQADFGLAAVLTKNRFLNMEGEQLFFHQFGIGPGAGLGTGFPIKTFQTSGKSIDLQVNYQIVQTRVEVNGIGDDTWRFGSLHMSLVYSF